MARVSVWDEPKGGRIVLPPTVPALDFPDIDVEREAREAQARVVERRVIRNGRDAWDAIGKVETLEAWLKIGAALHVGKLRAIPCHTIKCRLGLGLQPRVRAMDA
jgi:hypothetical protein